MAGQSVGGFAEMGGQVEAAERGGDLTGLGQAVADRGKVAGTGAVDGQPRQRPVEIGHPAQRLAQVAGGIAVLDHEIDGGEAGVDGGKVARGAGKAAFEQPRAAGGDGAVDGMQQRSCAAAGQGVGQFEVAPRGGVDLDGAVGGLAHGFAQQGQFPLLGDVEVIDDRAHDRNLGTGEAAEGVERGDAEQPAQPVRGAGAVEGSARQRRQGDPEIRDCFGIITLLIVLDQDLGRAEAGQFGTQPDGRQGHDMEGAGRDVDPGQGAFLA